MVSKNTLVTNLSPHISGGINFFKCVCVCERTVCTHTRTFTTASVVYYPKSPSLGKNVLLMASLYQPQYISAEVREQLCGVVSVLPHLHRFQGLTSGDKQAPIPNEPSCKLLNRVFK